MMEAALLERYKGTAAGAGGLEGSRTQAHAEAIARPARTGKQGYLAPTRPSGCCCFVAVSLPTFTDTDVPEIIPQWIVRALRALAEADTVLLIKN